LGAGKHPALQSLALLALIILGVRTYPSIQVYTGDFHPYLLGNLFCLS